MVADGDLDENEAKGNARVIVEQCTRMAQVVRQLLDFSRRGAARFEPTPLRQIVSGTLDLLSALAERRRVSIDFQASGNELIVRADANQIQQALMNVLVNGIQAMPDGGRLRVRIGSRQAPPPEDHEPRRDCACVIVEDEGSGIAEADLAHIFEPFFSTKRSGEGTGLGLAVAHGIVTEHGGWIDAESEVGKGSRFTLCLPVTESGHRDVREASS
jgi:signal transduction histidine kinase